MKWGRKNRVLFCSAVLLGTAALAAVKTVSIDVAIEEHAITKMAMGTGLVYSWYPDAMFADGEVAHIIKDIGVGALRWPGGAVVTYYHWNDLNGQGWKDNWDPSYDPASDLPDDQFQDLDEYLALIDETGAEIMLGVNMSSGKEWNREAAGIAEASNLMVYCQSQGYDVKYIFLDNESYHKGNSYNKDIDNDGEAWTAESYAHSFNLYAAAIKAIYPDAKLIANRQNKVDRAVFKTEVESMLSIAGANIDFIDLHFYWEWDNASWPLWKSQMPMIRTGSTQTYKKSVEYANNLFTTLGYPHVRTAVLEWNTGPGPWASDPDHTNFKTALMQTEMQIQFLQAGLEIGMLYALESPGVEPSGDKHVIRNGDPNATALWMWLFSKAVDKTVVQSSSPVDGVYVVALKGAGGELVTYLLNKTDADYNIEFDISGYTVSDVSEAWRFHDEGDGEGALMTIGVWETAGKKRTTLNADSLNMIGFNYPSNDVPTQAVIEANRVESIADGILVGWDTTSGAPDVAVPGVTGTLLQGNLFEVDDSAGSTDTTFGSAHSGATTALTAFSVRETNAMDTVAFSIINRSGAPLRLDAVHFDYSRWWSGSSKDVGLFYASGDLAVTNQTPVNSVADLAITGKTGNYLGFDWSLSDLADRVLDHGETATFELTVSNADVTGLSGAFDNIAISGGTITNAADAVLVSWRAQTGKKYTVQQATNLTSNDWNAASSTLIGRPGDMSIPSDLQAPSFYRLQIEP
jgi:hypothetical protein